MKNITKVLLLISSLFTSISAMSQNPGQPVNYLNTPVTLTFNNINYDLSWTSHPSAVYYKQEYIQKGEQAEKYTSMLMLELLDSKLTVKDAAAAKMAELDKMKKVNPYVAYETSYDAKSGEQILDFMITANAADGKSVLIAERNVYRYTPFVNEKGEKGLLLVAISVRGYGPGSKTFIESNKAGKAGLVTKMKDFKIPPIGLKSRKSA